MPIGTASRAEKVHWERLKIQIIIIINQNEVETQCDSVSPAPFTFYTIVVHCCYNRNTAPSRARMSRLYNLVSTYSSENRVLLKYAKGFFKSNWLWSSGQHRKSTCALCIASANRNTDPADAPPPPLPCYNRFWRYTSLLFRLILVKFNVITTGCILRSQLWSREVEPLFLNP